MLRILLITFPLLFLLLSPLHAADVPWRHPLYLDGGGHWRQRIGLEVENRSGAALAGQPVAITIGTGLRQADLAGERAEAVRVVDQDGVEVLFGIRSAAGDLITSGPVPADSALVIPAVCEANASARYEVYFDNPAAGEVPDFLTAQPGLVNGDLELGDGDAPAGWSHDAADQEHQATWTDESPHSGRRCLKTFVAKGAEPTWIATRQSGLAIVGGRRYQMRAWVKAENVRGFAGWYIHVGTREKSMMTSPMLNAGEGDFDWKEVRAEFTAPAEANLASLGTVLRGTGTAWFDSVELELLDSSPIGVTVRKPERLALEELPGSGSWYASGSGGTSPDRRVELKLFNFSDEVLEETLVSWDASMLKARLGDRPLESSVIVVRDGRPVAATCIDTLLLWPARIPARSVGTWHAYSFADEPSAADALPAEAVSPVAKANRVQNPGFEDGDAEPTAWTHTQAEEGVRFSLTDPKREPLGASCARMDVPHGASKAWRGWHQSVAVKPGKTYLLAAWLKAEDLRGAATVHVHLRTADGQLCKTGGMTSIGPTISGTTDWTRISGLLTMPSDATDFQIHLTTEASGTLMHDGLLLAGVIPAMPGKSEGRPLAESEGVRIWQMPAVAKVFRDDSAPRHSEKAWISAARNEREPLQIAIRSPRAMKQVRVEVDPFIGPAGAKLDDLEINVVGYVPIDHPTSYYRSESPDWVRKIPTTRGGCDGWPGLWPDPLLPQDVFDLEANATQPIWVTARVASDQPAGEYEGKVRLIEERRVVAELPLTLRVWDFTLPRESQLRAIYDVRLGPGQEWWDKSLDDRYPEIARLMADSRLCPDAVHPDPIVKYESGGVVADFSAFDKAAEVYFDQLKLPHAYTPWQFYLFGWGHPPKTIFGEKPYEGEPPYEGVDRGKLRPQYKRVYQACLKAFWDHLHQRGWADKFVLYISDEPFDRLPHIREQMKALCDMIHEVDPNIPIYSSTWRHVPDWDGYLDVWGIGHYGVVPTEKIAQLRAAGDRVWFTTDGQMCTDTPYCAVERLLPHYCFKYGAEAYEFWGVGWLTYNPYRFGWHSYIHQSDQPGSSYWVRYPNGDGFLLYPGKPIGQEATVRSIRFDQAREGVEDYEYLNLLKGGIERAKAAGRDASEAEEVLREAQQLVVIPNAGGRYSTRILADPRVIDATKRRLAEAIQLLGR
ncbi:MAG: DUF4091 domain-containing protein [Rhodopirellula sp.]|nr:DUF4091 domain-containing protein [Rhodopirellula sp.]